MVLDIERLAEIFDDDRPAIVDLLREASASLHEALAELRAAAAANDVATVRRAAHAMRGTAANVGAKALAAQIGAYETSARDGLLPTDGVVPLEAELGAFDEALEAFARGE
jgi:two-component system sensor histidine kinase/response regulator